MSDSETQLRNKYPTQHRALVGTIAKAEGLTILAMETGFKGDRERAHWAWFAVSEIVSDIRTLVWNYMGEP